MSMLGWMILFAVWCAIAFAGIALVSANRRAEQRARFFDSMRSYGEPKC